MKDAENLLQEIAGLFGLEIIWKYIGQGRDCCGFSLEHTLHCCEFCKKVKSNPIRLKKCSRNDTLLLTERVLKEQEPFIHQCHAGVSEFVFPVYLDREEAEVILIGIFRDQKQKESPYQDLRDLFAQLPCKKRTDFKKYEALIKYTAKILRERREILKLQDLTEKISDSRISECLLYLEKNYAKKIEVTEIARRTCLSKSRFQHLFKQETGKSFLDYLTDLRIKAATGYLASSDLPIRSVMELCGIADQSRFGVLFRKRFNCTPCSYRRNFRKKHFS